MNEPLLPTPKRRRRMDGRAFKTFPFAAWISAISLAWYVGAAWVHFRDTVFEHCHAVELRLAALDEYRLAHERADAERFARLLQLERQLAKQSKADE